MVFSYHKQRASKASEAVDEGDQSNDNTFLQCGLSTGKSLLSNITHNTC